MTGSTTGDPGTWNTSFTMPGGNWAIAINHIPSLNRYIVDSGFWTLNISDDNMNTWQNVPMWSPPVGGIAGFGGQIVENNGRLFSARSGGQVMFSDDGGLNWNISTEAWNHPSRPLPTNSSAGWRWAATGNGRVVLAGGNPDNTGLVSSSPNNGDTWTTTHFPTHAVHHLTFQDGRFWMVGDPHIVAHSMDGVNWTYLDVAGTGAGSVGGISEPFPKSETPSS